MGMPVLAALWALQWLLLSPGIAARDQGYRLQQRRALSVPAAAAPAWYSKPDVAWEGIAAGGAVTDGAWSVRAADGAEIGADEVSNTAADVWRWLGVVLWQGCRHWWHCWGWWRWWC
jgi:hypothetical protein